MVTGFGFWAEARFFGAPVNPLAEAPDYWGEILPSASADG